MAGKSWEFRGESKDWDNAWDHNWIRSKLVVGWSAAEGGPAASSHCREEATQTYLRRPCGKWQHWRPSLVVLKRALFHCGSC